MTSIACPCCRATNENGPNCRRCKADLCVLFSLVERRDYLMAVSERETLKGDFGAALNALDEADGLKSGPDIQRMRASVNALAGDFPTAWATYCDTIPNPATRP